MRQHVRCSISFASKVERVLFEHLALRLTGFCAAVLWQVVDETTSSLDSIAEAQRLQRAAELRRSHAVAFETQRLQLALDDAYAQAQPPTQTASPNRVCLPGVRAC